MQRDINNALQEITDLKNEAKSSKNKLRSFFESSSVIHLLIDTDLRVIDYNRAAVNFIKKHCKINIKVGTKASRLIHKDQVASFMENYVKALDGIPVRMEQEFKYGGERILWFLNYEPAWDCDGNILGMSYNAVDITEKVANENKIVAQYYSLESIAYIHSHHFRAPVTNIMGLMNIFKINGYKTTKQELLMMQRAVNELEVQMTRIENHLV
ncbi:PAS domain-containing protein [Pedobacter heparinus]|uniref:PAS sensor protein n=1 Tax=Pedobacter heparinus (strain ATCC 13125 / DSM 2366 / CIP 104194 / JCM 7457 / NBRC 12017 / NCIMB 9290 / NRRL B-14731 / HIM 762-3) TaxID=485917 RepID=C6XSR6_PEDHD|nr:PAS domain-containing protein [Pedobacter heparinus]ACU05629.1 PAS sensor protein [Pedobacter heparinus DSM 2366]